MAQRLLNVRIRPARATILISRDAEDSGLLLAFEFFSKIWGGRFGQILSVDPKACDDLTRFRLESSRPEFVYGIGLDDAHWNLAARQACQPRGYGPLTPDFVRDIKQRHNENYYLVDHALLHLFKTREQHKGRKQILHLVSPEISSPLAAFCGATFGIHYKHLPKEYFDKDTTFSDTETVAFVNLATEFVKEWQQSWLDVTGHELNPIVSSWGSGQLSPTVVLVGHRVQDLALYWNLRSGSDTTYPAWIIPIPIEDACEPGVLEGLKKWLLAFEAYGPCANYCLATSQTVDQEKCRKFASMFQIALGGTSIEFVDYEHPRNRLPVVTPFEYEAIWPVNISGRRLTIQPPRPKAFEDLGSSRTWVVDLVKDIKTDRAVDDLHLPSSTVVFELLNGPCPPNIAFTAALPRTGDGVESINILCSGNKEVVSIHLPSGEEILEEILREHGGEPLIDEKRSSYLPVIKKFGGLHSAAQAFSGKSRAILSTLQNDAKTVAEIRGNCKLGKGTVPGKSYLDRIEEHLQLESERIKRVGRRRFAHHSRYQSPENLQLQSILEYWSDRSVLTREWKIGPCSRCNKESFVPRLDIQKRVTCPACGNRITLHESVKLGYSLHRVVRLAMREGIVPVVLTGRFLHNMTNRGFFWLPGVKFKIDDLSSDIDLIACCDGNLVFCECKQLDDTPAGTRVWEDVVTQFLKTANVARRCEVSLVVLAAMVDDFPTDVRAQLESKLDGISLLLLTKKDLEVGYRDVEVMTHSRPLMFSDILPLPFPEQPLDRSGGVRRINMGWGILTR